MSSQTISGLALALKLKAEAANRTGLVRIKLGVSHRGVELDEFLAEVQFLDLAGEPTTDPALAAFVVHKSDGTYSHHTRYVPVANISVDVQEYPSQAHKDHQAYLNDDHTADDDETKGHPEASAGQEPDTDTETVADAGTAV